MFNVVVVGTSEGFWVCVCVVVDGCDLRVCLGFACVLLFLSGRGAWGGGTG